MAKNPERRARTGNRRRGAKRNKTRHHRNLHLTNLQVGYMQKLQRHCFFAGANSLNKLQAACHLSTGVCVQLHSEQR